jgi:hypothetical protein
VNGSLIQLVSAARLPSSGISEIAVNASWNMIEATIDTGKPIESDAEDPFSGLIKMFSDPKLPPHGHRRYVLIRRASGELVFQQDATDFWLEHAAASSCGTRPPSGPRVIRFDRGEKRSGGARASSGRCGAPVSPW